MQQTDVLIVGGGLAGLTAALHLARQHLSVLLIEKETYPHHKVCGEYVSNEVLSYLRFLNADPVDLNPVSISELEFTVSSGKKLHAVLPLGGFGISRYRFDDFLAHKAEANGCNILCDQVADISWHKDHFKIYTISGMLFSAKVVLGAFGKRSVLDRKLSRVFMQQKTAWLAVKGHYSGIHPDHVISLHHFKGGYCGISKAEPDVINICYLAQYDSFRRYKNIEEYQEKVLCSNPALSLAFANVKPLFSKPLTISQVSFAHKDTVENHILMVGDTAGLIHPLCGNGMAMAIHSAKMAAECVTRFLNGTADREKMEVAYEQQWNEMFRKRMRTGRRIAALFQKEKGLTLLTGAMALFPGLLPLLIRQTHGKPIKMNADVTEY
jgi:flavin-dependent dehydrogenase